MKFVPLFHRVEGRRCLIVGGGTVALRRAKVLAEAGALLDVIAPQIQPELHEILANSNGRYFERKLNTTNLSCDYMCIIAASNDRAANAGVVGFARSHKIPVNVADDQEACDFIFPAIIDRHPLTVAISNSGSSPVLSRLLRQQIDAYIPAAYGALSRFVGKNRERVRSAIAGAKNRTLFWEQVLQGAVAQAIYSGGELQAQTLLDEALAATGSCSMLGEVYLIGAGPGDPDLLTIRALRLLQQADVVLYDRLVSNEIMSLVREGAQLVYVGKQRNEHTVAQHEINQMLTSLARSGKRVARLKGGDPFVFGRGGEEIETLAEEGIPFQVVPGITAANGCSAYAGIPLTHRDYAQSVQFVTGQLKDGTLDLNWQELVAPGKTLVFYMALQGLPVIIAALIEHGMSKAMPVALVEKGTTHEQRVIVSSVGQLLHRLADEAVVSPSLLIVGQVVNLAGKLGWYATK